jgi:hypothetical protein
MTVSPRTNPQTWDRGAIGGFKFPPVERAGTMSVSCTGSIDVDEKKKAGAATSTSTVQSQMSHDVTVTLEWNNEHWDAIEPTIRGLMPDGLPRDIDHPKAQIYGVTSVLLKKVGDLEIAPGGGRGKITFSGSSWTPKPTTSVPVVLKIGSKGAEVTRWKAFLRSTPTNDANVSAGDLFDASAETATKTFQAAERLTVNGIVASETFTAASKYGYTPPKPLGTGSVTKTPSASTPLESFYDSVYETLDKTTSKTTDLFGDIF